MKNVHGANTDGTKLKQDGLKFYSRNVRVLQRMSYYEESSVNLVNAQLNKLRSAAKSKTRLTWRTTKKNSHDEELPHELFVNSKTKN